MNLGDEVGKNPDDGTGRTESGGRGGLVSV